MSTENIRRRRANEAPRLKVQITANEIKNGTACDSHHCMIAKAVQVAYPGAQYIQVDTQSIRFTDLVRGKRYTYLTPRKAQRHIVAFDQAGDDPRKLAKLEPLSFHLVDGRAKMAGFNATHRSYAAGTKVRPKANLPARSTRKSSPKTRINGLCQY